MPTVKDMEAHQGHRANALPNSTRARTRRWRSCRRHLCPPAEARGASTAGACSKGRHTHVQQKPTYLHSAEDDPDVHADQLYAYASSQSRSSTYPEPAPHSDCYATTTTTLLCYQAHHQQRPRALLNRPHPREHLPDSKYSRQYPCSPPQDCTSAALELTSSG